uniref:Uncharacterized protein n=1 Tax=Medicago truncatula TaxID=3880 RepID=I3S0T9_MEDTR|nr:unknown [Medicago truncatula]
MTDEGHSRVYFHYEISTIETHLLQHTMKDHAPNHAI